MFAKLCALILMAGAAGATTLVIRQQRLHAAAETAASAERAAAHDRALWRLRLRLGREITPAHVRELAAALGKLKPIDGEWCPPPVWCEPEGDAAPPSRATGAGAPR